MVLAARVTFRPFPAFLMIVPLAVLVSALAGGVLTPADSLNILAPYWWLTLFAVVAATACLFRGARIPALLLLVAFVIAGGVLFAPLLPASASPRDGTPLRIVTFNMHRDNPLAGEVAAWILEQNPDVVVLLEVSRSNFRAIGSLKSQLPYSYGCSPRGYCSTMIFARRPADDVLPLARGDADNRRAISALTARFTFDGDTVPITAVHLSHPWPLGRQADELDEIAIILATVGRSGIMTGDFNSVPWTFAMRRLAASGELDLASGAGGTWPAANPGVLRLPLDQVYLGQCFVAVSVRRGPAMGSDHLPIVTDLALGRCRR